MEQHTSRKSKVKLGTGQSSSDIFISTRVTKTNRKNQDGSPIFTTEVIRYPSANSAESDGVVIATGSNEDGAPKISKTANITNTEERFLTSKITQVRRQQMGSISSNFNLNAEEQKAYAEAGGTDRNPISQSQSNTDGTDPEDTKLKVDTFDVSITPEGIKKNYGSYAYPTKLGTNGQDFIQFSIKRYKPRNFNLKGAIGIIEERQQLDTVGTIALPIQPSISDSNNVDWNGLGINPLEMELASGSLNIMSQQGQQYVNGLIERLEGTIKDPNTLKAIKLYFAQKAAGVNGLLSRFGGGIVNPNMELLFQGPTLRPFTFTFRLSPRDNTEAKQVRSIIRVFKEAMSVKTASQQFFLAAPDVFDIRYCQRGDTTRDHPSLNKIKTCALKSCNVDYTPDGSYMTFNDENNTMVSYNLTLQFQELEPVTSKDYDDNLNQIGY